MGLVDLECRVALYKNKGDNSPQLKAHFKQFYYKYSVITRIALLIALSLQSAHSAEVSFSWNDTEGATGYKLYYGIESRAYTFEVDLGLGTQCTISDLDNGQGYYFAITAYNESEESEFSDELTCCSNTCDGDTDIDGDIDGSDLISIIVGPSAISLIDFAAGFGTDNCSN